MRSPFEPVDQPKGIAHELDGDRNPWRPTAAVVLVHDHAAPWLKRREEVAEDRIVDLPRLQDVEKENVDWISGPADFGNVTLVHDVRNVEATDVEVEAAAERIADVDGAVVREEPLDRVRLDAEEVVACDRRALPPRTSVPDAAQQPSCRSAEGAPPVHDRGG